MTKKRNRKKRRSNLIANTLKGIGILFLCAGALFAAMTLYTRKSDEEVVYRYFNAIASGNYDEAYALLDLPEDAVLCSKENFALYAEQFYKPGEWEIERKSSGTSEQAVYKAVSAGTSDHQVLQVLLNDKGDQNWKIDVADMVGVIHAEVPAEYGLQAGDTVCVQIGEENTLVLLTAFPSECTLTYFSDVYKDTDVTVRFRYEQKEASAVLEDEMFAVGEESEEELNDFSRALAKVFVQNICNGITVDTVLDPYSYPVYSDAVTAKIGDYLGEDYDPAIPWQIELEAGCRSTFYTNFASSYPSIDTSGSFGLKKTIVDYDSIETELTSAECSKEKEDYRFTYNVNMTALYSEDYFDSGSQTVKNSRTEERKYTLKITYSRHDGRWWVRTVTKPVRTA